MEFESVLFWISTIIFSFIVLYVLFSLVITYFMNNIDIADNHITNAIVILGVIIALWIWAIYRNYNYITGE